MKEVFLFSNFLSGNHDIIYLSHLILVVLISIILAKVATSRMQLVPKASQNIAEAYVLSVVDMGAGMIGDEKRARKYLPLVATIGFIVFFGNVLGIIPGFESPTANLNLTLALALCVFVYYHFEGIRKNGFFKYFAHFAGPSKVLAPLMFPIEVISHISRIISLSFRLFGNIKGDDLFLIVIITLVPYVAPLIPFAVLAFMAVLQTFVFMILTYVYLAGAIDIDEEH